MKMGWVLLAFLANGAAQFLYKYMHAARLGDYPFWESGWAGRESSAWFADSAPCFFSPSADA